ncbi:hypothetical protein NQ854_25470 [Rhodococcus ruber]|uniref:hypothetical protein n=1 Tax=Rhodococcus ruber TaxID=1830 RepID=UPI00387DC7C0
MVPATGPVPGDAQLTAQLVDTLTRRCPDRVAEGVALFTTDRQLREDIPDLNLRAGAAALLCTFGEPAVEALHSGSLFERVRFGTTPNPNAIAQVLPAAPGDSLPTIVFNERYRFEDFRALSSVLFHETLHQDSQLDAKEELIATAVQVLVYGQHVLANPEVATSGTELARRLNTGLMARINSGPGERLGLFTANGPSVLPGAVAPLPSFADAFYPPGTPVPDTPGNATLRASLALLGATPPPDADFDDATLSYIDLTPGLTNAQVLELARILRLDVPRAPFFGSS